MEKYVLDMRNAVGMRDIELFLVAEVHMEGAAGVPRLQGREEVFKGTIPGRRRVNILDVLLPALVAESESMPPGHGCLRREGMDLVKSETCAEMHCGKAARGCTHGDHARWR